MHKKKVVDLKNYRGADVEDADIINTETSYLPAGTTLLFGQYTIRGFINCGGFGITYLAEDCLQRKVAVKECFPSELCYRLGKEMQPRSPKFKDELFAIVDHFVDEAQRLARLSHKNIVHVHQVFEENATAYIVMDYVDGPDLLDIAESDQASLTPVAVEELATRMLGAISYVHQKGILHRDIAPDNILVSRKGEPVLIDFGAALKRSAKVKHRPSRLKFVKDGYSPQEFYSPSHPQNESSDLYSFAASLYHVIAGYPPEEAPKRAAAVAAKEADPYQPLDGRYSGYTPGFLACIDDALAVVPEKRIQSAGEWLERLDDQFKTASGGATRTAIMSLPIENSVAIVLEKAEGNGRWILGGVVAASLAFLAIGVLPGSFLSGSASEPAPAVASSSPTWPDVDLANEFTQPPFAATLPTPVVSIDRGVLDAQSSLMAPPRISTVASNPIAPRNAAKAPEYAVLAPTPSSVPDHSVSLAALDFTQSANDGVFRSNAQVLDAPLVPDPAVPDLSTASLDRVTLTSAGPALAAPSTDFASPAAVQPVALVDEADTLAVLPEAKSEPVFTSDVTPPSPISGPGAILGTQIAFAHWDVDMPFESALSQQRNANTATITRVSDVADLKVSGAWIKRGVTIYSFNGQPLLPDTPLSAHILSDMILDPDGYVRASVRYRDPETGTIDRGLLAVPMVRQIGLADGSRVEARIQNRAWVLSVAEAAEGSGLRAGDVISSEMSTGIRFEGHADLAEALDRLVTRGEDTARFAVNRNGTGVLVMWNLAREL